MGGLPGPERPIEGINWGKLVRQDSVPATKPSAIVRPRRIRPRHRLVVMLHEAGWKNRDIAKTLGYTESRISTILSSQHPELLEVREKFASEVADNIRDVQTRFKLYANEMVDIMVGHARQREDKNVSRLAARDMLHMGGFTPVRRQFLMSANIPAEELGRVLHKLDEANEVLGQYEEWSVKEPRSGSAPSRSGQLPEDGSGGGSDEESAA